MGKMAYIIIGIAYAILAVIEAAKLGLGHT